MFLRISFKLQLRSRFAAPYIEAGGTVMATGGEGLVHEVVQGECISSVAGHAGFLWETIWNHPANAQLKSGRKDPNILLPGDLVFVPRRTNREVDCATDQMHHFVRKGTGCVLRLQILENDEVQSNVAYTLVVDGTTFTGTTDGEGKLEHPIPFGAKSARLIAGPQNREYVLGLGELDPITEVTGIQGRLRNLDYYDEDVDGELNDATKLALEMFQSSESLTVTGEPDTATRERLLRVHGS
jgi:hypothetical protein